ncbi:TPR domain [Fusarium albosuccineum]|uniref:TPR domain n=1 Tax=Fusarium albosuccineum TaxID=1237068 RepID=A0A8H4KTI0_9HYPO|nr:TPR domain [Fusarium albosuccineum]
MDIKDVSKEDHYLTFMKKVQSAAERAARRKGQFVRDHPPPQLLVASFMMKIHAASISPLSSQENVVSTTQVPAPYPPCIVAAEDLKPISIAEMRLETHHRGRKVVLRVLTPPDRMTAIMAIVEDQMATAVLLQLYHQPVEAVVPAKEILTPDMVCILKEPFFKCATDGSYSLRVDHPSDFIWLNEGDERIPAKWAPSVIELNKDSKSIRMQGNDAVQGQQWAEAHRLYSSAIEAAQTSDERNFAFLNRSLANLRLGRPEKALSDAFEGTDSQSPSERALFREARASYETGAFERCLEKLQELSGSYPENKAASSELHRVKARLKEQQSGEYSFINMYKQAKMSPPVIDCATFSRPVEIRQSPGRGRGLFTTRPVSAGELLLCEKAFAYIWAGDDESTKRINILMNLVTKRMVMGGQALLLTEIVQKLYHGSQLSREFENLHHANYQNVVVAECDGVSVVDSFLVDKIISLNVFGSPRTSQETYLNERISTANLTETQQSEYTTSGIWLLASRINHSCAGNCRRSFIGDMQIVRATKDLAAGTELLFSYRYPGLFESYQEAQRHFENWGFTCDCELCMARKITPASFLRRRKVLFNEMRALFRNINAVNIPKLRRSLKSLEETYTEKNVKAPRLDVSGSYFGVGSYLIMNGQLKNGAILVLKGFEALGYSIIACPPNETANPPRLEVQRWGMFDNSVPFAFYNLFNVYRAMSPELCPAAKKYLEISYSIVVGEKETVKDAFPGIA